MAEERSRTVSNTLERFSGKVTEWAGTSWAFALSVAAIVAWIATGPLFHFSDTWQLVINTGTTIVTFLMVFLIQRAQNKEARAMQLKLNEIVAALEGASNRLVDVEDLSEEELQVLQKRYQELADRLKKDGASCAATTVEEAARGTAKVAERKQRTRKTA